MERRTLIKRSLLVGAGLLFTYTGVRLYEIFKKPDLAGLGNWIPVIDALADTIIPPTSDSPGAQEAVIGKFIVKLVCECTDRPSQNKFLEGLSDLAATAQHRYRKSFDQCSAAERIQLLKDMEAEEKDWPGKLGKLERRYTGESFFSTIKRCTVIGFCTSETGATKALAYDYIPGHFTGVLPLVPGQKAWATQ